MSKRKADIVSAAVTVISLLAIALRAESRFVSMFLAVPIFAPSYVLSRPARSGKGSLTLGLICLATSLLQSGVHAQNDPAKYRNYADGPLTAEDFQAPIPGFVQFRGQLALTTTDFRYDFQYRLYHSRRRITARLSSIDIWAAVIPSESWNRRPEDARLMDHEQGHFDLTYIAVLRARRDFSNPNRLVGGGTSDEQAVTNLRRQLDRRFGLLRDELRAAHVKYDEITSHGTALGPQKEQRDHQKQQIRELTKGRNPENQNDQAGKRG